MELFKELAYKDPQKKTKAPLAERMRPSALKDFLGQEELLGDGCFLGDILKNGSEKNALTSLILWGPPGTGKTTLARIIAKSVSATFIEFSAVLSGVKDIREVIKEAKTNSTRGVRTVLFVDEIHRFNKSQQDGFLHSVEDGTITLIGATTENPSFEINAPLLSRCKVLTLKSLSEDALQKILLNALNDKTHGLRNVSANEIILRLIASYSAGDARMALSTLEAAVLMAKPDQEGFREVTLEIVKECLQGRALRYDKKGEEHYNVISAFIKSMRGSDPDAALYWLSRMLNAGEDPLFIARRMVIFASEDIGNADPSALTLAMSVKDAVHFIGPAEGWIPLAQGVTYLATAKKSNASYVAFKAASKDANERGALSVPMHLRNAPTKLMSELGYSKGYKYPHDYKDAEVSQEYLPPELKGKKYYTAPNTKEKTEKKS
ncbi:MAG: replication-associated recombination protein A [Deltaproteobacteria bacterium]|nr:replication-associated recombination protein A [Deltaproteobacteria bacterium]